MGGDDLLPASNRPCRACRWHATLDLPQPEEAFGDYDEERVFLELRERFPQELEEGMTFEIFPPAATRGTARLALHRHRDLPGHVVLDGNRRSPVSRSAYLRVQGVRETTEERDWPRQRSAPASSACSPARRATTCCRRSWRPDPCGAGRGKRSALAGGAVTALATLRGRILHDVERACNAG